MDERIRPSCAVSSTDTVPSEQPEKKNPLVSSNARPRDDAQPFGHSATISRDATSMTTVDACQRCVYARPALASMTSDSGPLSTWIVPADTGVGSPLAGSENTSMRDASGSVTQSSFVDATKRM